MKLYQIKLHILVTMLIVGCSVATNTNDVIILDFSPPRFKEIQSNQIVGKVAKIIQFQQDSVLIGRIKKVIFVNDRIILHDVSGNGRVLVFNITGKFLHTLSSYGRGPREYQEITDICQEDQDILILSKQQKSILKYTTENEFINQIRLKSDYSFAPRRIETNDNRYFYEVYNPNYNILTTDKKGKFKHFDFQISEFFYHINKPLSRYKNFVYYHKPFNDTIYRSKDGRLKPFLFFDFADNHLDIKKYKALEGSGTIYSYIKTIPKRFCRILSFEESTDAYYSEILLHGEKILVQISKESPYCLREVKYNLGLIEENSHGITFLGLNDNNPIILIQPAYLASNLSEMNKFLQLMDHTIKNISLASNPILIEIEL